MGLTHNLSMTPSQSKRLQTFLKVVQDLRRSLDKEVANGGIKGVAQDFGNQIDLDDALFGILYTEKALGRIWERENFIRELPDKTKAHLRIVKP
jgi:hypothetical protein